MVEVDDGLMVVVDISLGKDIGQFYNFHLFEVNEVRTFVH